VYWLCVVVVIEPALVTISPAIFSVSNAAFFIVLSQYSAGSVLHSLRFICLRE